jgi:hypothetical protein
MQSVSVDDLNSNASVIGRLGKPLGTVVTIRGRAVQNGPETEKAPRNFFQVQSVDGQPVNVGIEVILPAGAKFPIEGTAGWIGYEDGGFVGEPQQGLPMSTMPVQQRTRSFVTQFHALRPAQPEQAPGTPATPPAGQFG